MDFTDDVVLMGHDGPGHLKIAEGKTKVPQLNVYHGKVGRGLSVEMAVKHGAVTLLSVVETKNCLMLLVAEGEFVAIGEFCLSHPNIQCPEYGNNYSFNQGNFSLYHPDIKRYINSCQERNNLTIQKYTHRYSGSMVADIHRNLLKGGFFIYPATIDTPTGKLRLQYECNPIAFIYEMAGGTANDGVRRILDIKPHNIHQRCQIFIGSKKMLIELSNCLSHLLLNP